MTTPPDSHLDLLTRPVFAHLATVGEDGAPRSNPMWFLYDPDANRVLLTHTRTRHNYRFLQREPRVALSIADPDDPYRYLQLRGEIESEEADPEGDFYNRLQQRYRGRTSEVKDRAARVVFRIRPTAWKAR
jgi:PPOX class probable F420-dependent enzyme